MSWLWIYTNLLQLDIFNIMLTLIWTPTWVSGQLVPESTRTLFGQLVPKSTRTLVNSYPSQLVPFLKHGYYGSVCYLIHLYIVAAFHPPLPHHANGKGNHFRPRWDVAYLSVLSVSLMLYWKSANFCLSYDNYTWQHLIPLKHQMGYP